jgi:hypothetical protein
LLTMTRTAPGGTTTLLLEAAAIDVHSHLSATLKSTSGCISCFEVGPMTRLEGLGELEDTLTDAAGTSR